MDYHFKMRYITIRDVSKTSTPAAYPHFWFFLSTTRWWRHYVFGLAVCPSVHLSICLAVSLPEILISLSQDQLVKYCRIYMELSLQPTDELIRFRN